MAIISRGAGVALLLVGLALLPGNMRAAGPSYDDYVAQVKAGKIEIGLHGVSSCLLPPARNTAPLRRRRNREQAEEGLRRRRLPISDGARRTEGVWRSTSFNMEAHKDCGAVLPGRRAGNEEDKRGGIMRRSWALFGSVPCSSRATERARGNRLCRHRRSTKSTVCVGGTASLTPVFKQATGEPRGIRLRPVEGQVAGVRKNGNAVFQRRSPARAHCGANVTAHCCPTDEEAVNGH
jgi:hypothetical protein